MKDLDDTIAAISTPPGEGGVGIVRISGPGAKPIGERLLFTSEGASFNLKDRSVGRFFVRQGPEGQVVDEVLAILMEGPGSYTREDVVEVQCHGGRAATRAVLELVLGAGARFAEPGEFTLRAFLRGRIDLVQAEAVLDVIQAETSESLKVHERLLEGRLSREVEGWQKLLGEALVHVESQLDFPEEEDIDSFDVELVLQLLEGVAVSMSEKVESYSWGKGARDGFNIALIGSPNAGKSSILNCLAESDRAIVSDIPGTTRDTIETRVNVLGVPVHVVDTAGLRESGDFIEAEGVRRARTAGELADLVLYVADGSRPPTEGEIADGKSYADEDQICVVNKTDLGSEGHDGWRKLFGKRCIPVSAKTGNGLSALMETIRERCWAGHDRGAESPLTRLRHRQTVAGALQLVNSARSTLGVGGYLETAGADLQNARTLLGELLGWGSPEDVLESIFSEFCIGK